MLVRKSMKIRRIHNITAYMTFNFEHSTQYSLRAALCAFTRWRWNNGFVYFPPPLRWTILHLRHSVSLTSAYVHFFSPEHLYVTVRVRRQRSQMARKYRSKTVRGTSSDIVRQQNVATRVRRWIPWRSLIRKTCVSPDRWACWVKSPFGRI